MFMVVNHKQKGGHNVSIVRKEQTKHSHLTKEHIKNIIRQYQKEISRLRRLLKLKEYKGEL